jgi:hypothetical protein
LAPLRRDTDKDGLPDSVDARFLTDPNKDDADGDETPDGKDLNPLAPTQALGEVDRIRQIALERLNYWHERKPDMSRPAGVLIIVTDGEQRQEFAGCPGVIVNLSSAERQVGSASDGSASRPKRWSSPNTRKAPLRLSRSTPLPATKRS